MQAPANKPCHMSLKSILYLLGRGTSVSAASVIVVLLVAPIFTTVVAVVVIPA